MSAKLKPWFDAKRVFAGMTGNTLITRPANMAGRVIKLHEIDIGPQFAEMCGQIRALEAQRDELFGEAHEITSKNENDVTVARWNFDQLVAKLNAIRDQQLEANAADVAEINERLELVKGAVAALAREEAHIDAEVPR